MIGVRRGVRGQRFVSAMCAGGLLLAAGCATVQLDGIRQDPHGLLQQTRLAGVPFVAQPRNYCGPASLLMMLAWAGDDTVSLDALAAQVYTPGRQGSFQADMLAAARRHGKLAVPVHTLRTLLQELDAGHPVLILQNLGLSWYPKWHYAVATGYDLRREVLFLHSGAQAHDALSLDTFERTWERGNHWALLVLPTDTLPAAAAEGDVTEAAAGLEQAGHRQAAEQVYRRIVARWPRSLEGRIGLANTRYAAQDLPGAILELQAAVAAHPDAAPAWHNLAVALHENGEPAAARHAAHQALQLVDATLGDDYRRSLAEIENF